MNILDELAVLGLDAREDSMGLYLRGPAEALTAEVIEAMRSRKAEIREALRARGAAAPPPAPPGRSCCRACSTPSGTAAKCGDCAAKAVPVTAGGVGVASLVCPRCTGPTWRAGAACVACELSDVAASRWEVA